MFFILELQSLILTNVSHSGAPKPDFDECFALRSKTVLEELWRSAGGALESSGGGLEELWRSSGGGLEELWSSSGAVEESQILTNVSHSSEELLRNS